MAAMFVGGSRAAVFNGVAKAFPNSSLPLRSTCLKPIRPPCLQFATRSSQLRVVVKNKKFATELNTKLVKLPTEELTSNSKMYCLAQGDEADFGNVADKNVKKKADMKDYVEKAKEKAEAAKEEAESTKDRTKEEASSMAQKAKESTKEATRSMGEKAKETAESARDKASHATYKTEEMAKAAKDRTKEGAKSIGQKMKETAEEGMYKTKDYTEKTKEKTEEGGSKVIETAESLGEKAKETMQGAWEVAKDATQKIKETVIGKNDPDHDDKLKDPRKHPGRREDIKTARDHLDEEARRHGRDVP